MTPPIMFMIAAVLVAALLHAVWNTVVKGHSDRFTMMLMIAVVQLSIALSLAPFLALPAPAAWPWLLATAVPHTTYKIALSKAYDAGDMTRIYPIARGLSIVMVTAISLFILKEQISIFGMLGIVVISIGVFTLSMRESIGITTLSRRAVILCVAAGSSVAIYSVLDAVGVRLSGDVMAFAVWMFIFDGLGMVSMGLGWSCLRSGIGVGKLRRFEANRTAGTVRGLHGIRLLLDRHLGICPCASGAGRRGA